MRPHGPSQEIDDADEQLWDELDAQWFTLGVTERPDSFSGTMRDGLA